ncbi:hypothetical protein STEG23_031185 [Scotinomys teguina]
MAAMLLPAMKSLLLLVQRKIARTIELQESIGKGQFGEVWRVLGHITLCAIFYGQNKYPQLDITKYSGIAFLSYTQ